MDKKELLYLICQMLKLDINNKLEQTDDNIKVYLNNNKTLNISLKQKV